MGVKVVEVIPYNSFKERIKITRELFGKDIEVFDKFIMVWGS